MKNIFALLGAAVVVLLGVGWYEDWFQFKTKVGANGDNNISIDIDATKAANDIKAAEQGIEHKIEEAKKAKSDTPATTTPAPAPAKDKLAPSVELKDSPKDPKFELNLFGPDKTKK